MARELATSRQSPVEIEIRNRLHEIAELHPQGKSDRVKQQLFHALSQSVTKNPQLAQCDPSTIIIAACQAVALGLDLNPVLGEAYLVPRWNKELRGNECCFQPGYQGLVKLARRGGQVVSIRSAIVYDADDFSYSYTPDLRFHHEPAIQQPGAIGNGKGVKAVYAVAKLANGEMVIEVMTVAEIEAIRAVSKSAGSGPWVSFWGEMAKKTVLRRLIKMLPKSEGTESEALVKALEYNDADYEDFSPKAIDNKSGHGTGKYARPDQVKSYMEGMEKYLDQRNKSWKTRWKDPETGLMPDGSKEQIATKWGCDKHLLKWCIANGMLDPSIEAEGLKNNQIGKFTAVAYFRNEEDRKAMSAELRKYLDDEAFAQEEDIRRKNPHLFEDDSDDLPVDGGFDDLTEDNFIQEAEVVTPTPEPAPKGKAKPKSLVEENDPEVWGPGRE